MNKWNIICNYTVECLIFLKCYKCNANICMCIQYVYTYAHTYILCTYVFYMLMEVTLVMDVALSDECALVDC